MNVNVPSDILNAFETIVSRDDTFEFFLVGYQDVVEYQLFVFQCNFQEGRSKTLTFKEIKSPLGERIIEVMDNDSVIILYPDNKNPSHISMPILDLPTLKMDDIKDTKVFSDLMNNLMKDVVVNNINKIKLEKRSLNIFEKLALKLFKYLTS